MSRRLHALGAAAGLLALGGGAAPAAHAAWAPSPEILSVDNQRLEQGDGATVSADLAGGGRYAVFQTRARNFFADADPDPAGRARQGAIFRADRQTGALSLVADGDETADDGGAQVLRGAANPSVSADGRWVVFSTAQPLVPQDTNDNVDVYVRDMDVALQADRQAGRPYELVSALSGTDLPPNYEPRDPPLPGRTPGTDVYRGAAISDDGRFVAFRTVEQRNDLAGGPLGTPAGTVFVRDRQTKRTVLVSRALEGGGPAGGSETPVVLSQDGSTVSWVTSGAQAQTRFLAGESADDSIRYYLWRRWDDPGATTRRITGSVDLDDPACPANGTAPIDPTATGPCTGPLTDSEQGFASISARPPSLSADGYTVAFLTGANKRPAQDNNAGLDAFVTSMRPGVTRKAGTTQLTVDTSAAAPRANAEIESVALSPDASRLAFTTARTQFLLSSPVLGGRVRTANGPTDLYVVDLAAGTMERAIFGAGFADANGAVQPGVSFSQDSSSLAYLSAATNLLSGDANGQVDLFVSSQAVPVAPTAIPVRPQLTATPAPAPVAPTAVKPALRVTASSRKDGTVRLLVKAPLAGRLSIKAAVKGRRKPVASAARRLSGATTSTVLLRLGKADRRKLRRKALKSTVTVRLTPTVADAAVSKRVTVRFALKAKKAKRR